MTCVIAQPCTGTRECPADRIPRARGPFHPDPDVFPGAGVPTGWGAYPEHDRAPAAAGAA